MKKATYFIICILAAQFFTSRIIAAEQVTVLIAYTTGARQFVDGNPNVFDYKPIGEVLIRAIAEMNIALANSGVTSFTMAFAKAPFEVTWTESGNPLTELSNMRANKANLVTLRDQYKADIVVLAVRAIVGASGIGFIPGMPAGYCGAPKEASLAASVGKGDHAYSVCDIEAISGRYLTNRYVLAHEIGHNFGLLHDETTCINEANTCGLTPEQSLVGRAANYVHGYVDPSSPAQWHTIMSYPKDGSTRILYFSNPYLTPTDAGNDAIGVWDLGRTIYAYSAKLLQDNAEIYAGWRTPCSGSNCSKYCTSDAGDPSGYRCVDCLNNTHCKAGETCIDGKCVYVSACQNATCGSNQICKEDASAPNGYKCIDDPCVSCPGKCITDGTSPSGWKCVECKYTNQCSDGYECVNNTCVKKALNCSPSPCPSSTPYCSESLFEPYYTCNACNLTQDCPTGKICKPVNGIRRCVASFTCSKSHSISVIQEKSLIIYSIDWGNGSGEEKTFTSFPSNQDHKRTFSHTYTVTHALGETANYNVYIREKGYSRTLASNTATINCATALPIVTISGTPTSGILPLAVSLSHVNTGGPIDIWNWDFGDGGTSTSQNPSHIYNTAGKYTIRLTVTGPGGTVTATKYNYLNVTALPPVINFQASKTIGASPLSVSFTATNTGGPVYSWLWDFGDGFSSSIQNPMHVFSKSGKYTITLTATGPAVSDVETKIGYIDVKANISSILNLLLMD
jgi:PKD repeat protein